MSSPYKLEISSHLYEICTNITNNLELLKIVKQIILLRLSNKEILFPSELFRYDYIHFESLSLCICCITFIVISVIIEWFVGIFLSLIIFKRRMEHHTSKL